MARKRRNDAKLEAFAGELAKGLSPAKAAEAVGYVGSSMEANARKRAQRPDVRARVAELRAEATVKAAIKVEQLIAEAESALRGAMSAEDWSAANQCIQTIAKLTGQWRDKVVLDDLIQQRRRSKCLL
jgi:phage terminase small subunit